MKDFLFFISGIVLGVLGWSLWQSNLSSNLVNQAAVSAGRKAVIDKVSKTRSLPRGIAYDLT